MTELTHKPQYLGVSIWSGADFYKTHTGKIVKIPDIYVSVTIAFIGHSDYWSGHGHVFEDDLIACARFGVYVDYTETVGEIVERITDEINAYEWDNVNDSPIFDEICDNVTDSDIETAIKDTLIDNIDDKQRFFDCDPIPTENDEYGELPQLIGWLHVYEIGDN